MREADVEKILVDGVKAIGGIAYKFVSPGNIGVPDRLLLLPDGKIYFVELKTEVGKLSPPQQRQIARIRNLGAQVVVLHGRFEVLNFLDRLEKEVIGP